MISDSAKILRRQSNEDVIGTSAMEGQFLDEATLALMRRFEEGELDREQLSAAIRLHVQELLAARHSASSSAVNAA
jgi:hypothetical protein